MKKEVIDLQIHPPDTNVIHIYQCGVCKGVFLHRGNNSKPLSCKYCEERCEDPKCCHRGETHIVDRDTLSKVVGLLP